MDDDKHATETAFAARAVKAQAVWTVRGEDGLGRVASPTRRGAEVNLFWSSAEEAARWADVVCKAPQVKSLTLGELYVDVLPRLAELNRLVGPDWGSDPTEPELEPAEFVGLLREAAVAQFVAEAIRGGKIWVLQGLDGPVRLVSRNRPDALMLPCWSDRVSAEKRIEGPLSEAVAAPIPVGVFLDRTLMWIAETRLLVAPAYCEGQGGVELTAPEIKGRLRRALTEARRPAVA